MQHSNASVSHMVLQYVCHNSHIRFTPTRPWPQECSARWSTCGVSFPTLASQFTLQCHRCVNFLCRHRFCCDIDRTQRSARHHKMDLASRALTCSERSGTQGCGPEAPQASCADAMTYHIWAMPTGSGPCWAETALQPQTMNGFRSAVLRRSASLALATGEGPANLIARLWI